MFLSEISRILADSPELSNVLTYDDLTRFIDIVRWKREDIASVQPSFISGPPEYLPTAYHHFFAAAFSLGQDEVQLLWTKLRILAWGSEDDTQDGELESRAKALIPLFLKHALQYDIGFYNFRPPARVCTDSHCDRELRSMPGIFRPRELTEPLSYKAVYFSKDLGPMPVWCTSLYCRHCNTRYYPNFYVHDKATTRTYYRGIPDVIQSAQHAFFSRDLCELFATLNVVSWTSATNCARIHNLMLSPMSYSLLMPEDWPVKLPLDVDKVWDAFFLYSLLLDHDERHTCLELRHDAPSQWERLRPAVRARNLAMAGPGQPEWNHACDLCCWVSEDEEGQLWAVRSVVTDGVSIGHPCCAVHDCQEPLMPMKGARYCRLHAGYETKCAVISCDKAAEVGFATCATKEHREMEKHKTQAGKAMFQLKRRLERLHVSQTHDSLSTSAPVDDPLYSLDVEGTGTADEEATIDSEDVPALCNGKPPTGNRKYKAQFGRRRTHNEELCVTSCGVIIGRATFFGSEAPNGVRVFLMKLFPKKRSLPQVLWHDNNCQIQAMLANDPEDLQKYFEYCAMPVDVFHFKSKHRESDIACNAYCNPYIWEDLRTEEGTWRFNSSAAEQANAWFGGYQSMVREMDVDRYNFFLDEMIKRRNRLVIAELDRRGRRPYNIPREDLLSD
ncbi:hypothetical protein GLOTRDRAFT_44279 [Gloeophyllum trabeum ATCC 11539]|uniref:CxC5 like cysteine cluster associated with KDZ domain-containing protein n=1 Tax=Gloeophyllum trabeum (strain ATCC 11539 / FP-39264 / Madison 617) TaxID=670483 RepID=S7RIK4_GLOTA|nr:uncharacterized protein GLOTRDRAFT_44279 [Gloeophyllum trabeum ATCC 11539]EPQ54160.1 hypothetical protein GLOTRDRAFT_44279 [Gloeophyllum trabeum ATCC 11539]